MTPEWIDFEGERAVRIVTADGAQAIVTARGAQALSWRPAGSADERLYLSDFRPLSKNAIRGGVPVIFPQFGTHGSGPRHGFARQCEWVFDSVNLRKDFACVTFALDADEATRALWPHAFHAEMTVAVSGARLDLELEVENRDEAPFVFTAALHTYLRVAEVETVRLEGLRGRRYADSANGGREALERHDGLIVEDEVDRIYYDTPATLLLREPHRALAIEQEGFRDTVVWNPWEHKCAAIADMPASGFRRMLCVEAATIREPVTLAAGESWVARQSLVAL